MRGAGHHAQLVPQPAPGAARAGRLHAPARRLPLSSLGPAEFAARLNRLGPFEPAPRIAVAASGGADSSALALLASDWARRRGGSTVALVVDHGLRDASRVEARLTAARLEDRGVPARVLTIDGLARGPALAARARAARYDALEGACAEAGIVHLLLGHHAADQAETAEMRARASSGPLGRAGMSAIRETDRVRLLRPLLDVDPETLRVTLRAAGMAWVEDPSNRDMASLRARLRAELDDPREVAGRAEAARRLGEARAAAELRVADALAAAVAFHPEGYAVVGALLEADALAIVLGVIGGGVWPPARPAAERLARDMRSSTKRGGMLSGATLGGVRVLPGGRFAPGAWIFARESAAMAAGIPAEADARWDGRFRLRVAVAGAAFGALGAHAAGLRRRTPLPSAVLETLPAVTRAGELLAVPHLGVGSSVLLSDILWMPAHPATMAPFAPAFG